MKMTEENFSWLELKGKGLTLPFILITILYVVITLFKGMLSSMLSGMGISITFNYLGADKDLFLFLNWAIYVMFFMQIMVRFVGLIGEWIRFVVWGLYFYYWFYPFGMINIKLSIPNMADAALTINLFYLTMFFLVIMLVNQLFKTRIQLVKLAEGDEFDEDNPPSTIGQIIVGYLCFAFAMYWLAGLFGIVPLPLMNYIAILSGYVEMLVNLIVGLIKAGATFAFNADLILVTNQMLFIALGFILFGILGAILGPKKEKEEKSEKLTKEKKEKKKKAEPKVVSLDQKKPTEDEPVQE
jgi:hypothetical protein